MLRRGVTASALLAAVGLVLLALTFKPVVENDGVGYFVYLHSVVIDHDLDLSDEYAEARAEGVIFYQPLFTQKTAKGLAADYFPVGPALLATPLYIAALAIAPRGQPEFGPPFSIAITVASLLYGLLALALAYLLAAEVAGRRAAGIGVAVVAGATSFAYYLVYEPSYSHTFSAFAVGAFLLAWWRSRDRRSSAGWLGLGLLGGLMALTRFQDGALVAIALLDLPRARWRVLLLAPGLVLAFLPQVAVDQALFGTWLPIRPAGQELSLASGHYLEVLFSSYHGLFSWTPATLLAVAGFALLRERRLQLAFAYALIVETAINGAAPDWWGGFSFGMRRFLDLTPFFAIGLAVLAARLAPRAGRLGAGALIAWNLVLVANFTYVIRVDRDPGFGGLLAGQVPALRYLPNLFVQGAVVRDLILWPVLHTGFQPLAGLSLLLAQAGCVALALWVAQSRRLAASLP